jgi:heme A synthase
VVRRIWQIDEAAHVHVRAAVVFLVLAAVLTLWLWREGDVATVTTRLGAITAGVVAAQIALGEYQYRNALPWEVVLVHVSLAALGWALVVAIVWSIARPVGERRAPRISPSGD